jgi:2-C-methyl-D-erythritol 4-phosphate cytidylyltransferase
MVVLAGGVGRRLRQPIPKQFLLLAGKPLIVHVLEKARAVARIDRVVVACPDAYLAETAQLLANHGFNGKIDCVLGGATRQESVYRGLCALDGFDTVIIHEAVRPLVTADDFERLLDAPDRNAIYGTPVPFTVLKAGDQVEGLLDRDELINVQLPQKFERKALLSAHELARRDGAHFTEDAGLFFRYAGAPVRVLPGSDRNIKITVPIDIVLAEAIHADLMGRL